MLKKILIIFVILVFLTGAGIVYLNSYFLPAKIKTMIINGLKEQTQKDVALGSLNFSILKGLVLKDLVIADKEAQVIKVKEASCGFLIFPIFFKKALIIPFVHIKSADIFLERRKDGSFNIQDLFAKKPAQGKKSAFNIFVRKVAIRDSAIRFQDDTLGQHFKKNIEDIDLDVYLSLPDKIKFNFDAEIASGPKIKLKSSGEYRIAKKEWNAKVFLRDLSPKEFAPYYQDSGISIPSGRIDGSAEFNYSSENRRLNYNGKLTLINLGLRGIKFAEEIDEINAEAEFSNSGLSAQNLSAKIFAIPIKANFAFTDFSNPLFNVEISAALDLNTLRNIARDKFKLQTAEAMEGEAKLYLKLEGMPRSKEPLQLSGYLDVIGAMIEPPKLPHPVEEITGRVEFTADKISWPGLSFRYMDIPYSSSGTLSDFKAPAVKFTLLSKTLALEADFNVKDKVINLSKFAGQYFNSLFSLSGKVDTAKPPALYAALEGKLQIDLKDLKSFFKESSVKIEKINPAGIINTKFSLNGDLNDFKSCAITGRAAGNSLSIYGLKTEGFSLDYAQANGIAEIPLLSVSLYGGTLKAGAQVELYPREMPLRIGAALENLKLEKLKNDTPAKTSDIAGNISMQAKLSGELADISKLNGTGEVLITDGKLWQLNLFKGMGALIFVRDFANIVFQQASCTFLVKDKYVTTNDIKMLSNVAELDGGARIGFDGSIDSAVNVKILDEAVPLTGTFKDITTALLGRAGKFGVIRVTGKLNDAKYKFQPAVVDIIKGIADTFLKKKD